MEQLVINICASSDSFGAYSVNCDGIWAAGDTIDECKADVARAIEAIKANLPEDRWPAPIRGEYTIVWHYDTQSLLLQLSRFITMAGLERMTGINQKQLWAYMLPLILAASPITSLPLVYTVPSNIPSILMSAEDVITPVILVPLEIRHNSLAWGIISAFAISYTFY